MGREGESARLPGQAIGPLRAEHLSPALEVIEAAQSLATLDDVAEMLAALAHHLTEALDADACLISVVDPEMGVVRNRAGFARPPSQWERTPSEHRISEYPRTAEVLETGEPYACTLGSDADPSEARWLVELGYRSLLMLALPVDDDPYALIEIYDRTTRVFAETEVRLCQALAVEAGRVVARARMQERLEDAYFATLGTLAAALEAKDAYTNDHASQIADLAGAVCDQLDIAPAEARIVRLGALLHDIGKIGVPEAILRKDGPLDDEEWAIMHEHPTIGARILEPVPYFAELVPLVSASHERYDGRGYPDRLAGDEIPLGSRVIAVCDAFHAMTEDRVYRKAMPVRDAIAEIARCSGSQFDPRCVDALLNVVRMQGWPRVTRDRLVRLAHQAV
ncbi:MAG: HD domain-containing phosphohydrolase [Gaiellales bacterium]